MTKEEKKKIRLARAKRTAFGRFLCRLFGDNAGQAMMEYVVLGVLVVAAVVALVVLFGENIGYNIKIMIYTLTGNQTEIARLKKEQEDKDKKDVPAASGFQNNIDGGGVSQQGSSSEASPQ